MSLENANHVINGSSIHFARMNDFNDPFEGAYVEAPEDYICGDLERKIFPNTFKDQISKDYVILALSKTPLDPLMWAHYGDNHKGCVIAIDAEVAGFMDEETCVIPAQQGEVKYPEITPNTQDAFDLLNLRLNCFDKQYAKQLTDAFLYKADYWQYEQEVRVVKKLNHASNLVGEERRVSSGVWEHIAKAGKEYKKHSKHFFLKKEEVLNLYLLPEGSIKYVYLGGKVSNSGVAHFRREESATDPELIHTNLVKNWLDNGIDVRTFYCNLKGKKIEESSGNHFKRSSL